MTITDICHARQSDIPIIATAIHDGHNMSDNLRKISKLSNTQRLREEDPFTGLFAHVCKSCIVAKNSRFEVDLNRPRNKAIYKKPEDAWGLDMWSHELSQKHIDYAMMQYDTFYNYMRDTLDKMLLKHSKIVVLDIHSYNHRRGGERAPFDSPVDNPDVIIGTGTMHHREQWADIIDGLIGVMSSHYVSGRYLDVRENIKFQGGEFARWIHDNYADNICCISIEFKKIFMNEWDGISDNRAIDDIRYLVEKCIEEMLICKL